METEETAEIMEDVVVTTMMVLPPSSMMELATKRSGDTRRPPLCAGNAGRSESGAMRAGR